MTVLLMGRPDPDSLVSQVFTISITDFQHGTRNNVREKF